MFPVVLMKNKMQICWVSNSANVYNQSFFHTYASFVVPQQMLAQFQDDFSDNDFINSPAWGGMETFFTVANNQLKLQAPNEDGVAFLSTSSRVIQDAIWEFKIFLEFNPSASNYTRVYVISDQADLSGPLNGYFVLVGDNKDDVSLCRQTGTTFSKIIDGMDGTLNASTVNVKIKVTRDEEGKWHLFSDVGATNNYIEEGIADDAAFTNSRYFGVLCTYTSSRADKFYFDDFNVTGKILEDNIPPALDSVEIISSRQLKLTFSEPLDHAIATKIENFSINNGIGNPQSATLGADDKTIELLFATNFSQSTPYTLTVSGITDGSGNRIETTSKDFLFHTPVKANHKDIIITEIFADPSPSIGLPESEFVEIYNRSENTFNLMGWRFTDQSSTAILPDIVLRPKGYLILTSQNSSFDGAEMVLLLSNFPTLNNVSDVLILKDENGTTTDSVSYFEDWYKDEDKNKGGWSLELIDPNNLCSEHENWIASENSTGGSPGTQNSVFANKPDLTGPKLLSAIPVTTTLIQLKFDEKLEKQLPSAGNFTITPEIAVSTLSFTNSSLTEFYLFLNGEIQTSTPYTIKVSNTYDCSGNSIQQHFATTEFGLTEHADSLDILINEILFNPMPTGVDFVEIVNNSSKFINLKDWSIATMENGVLKNWTPILIDFLFRPGSYLVFTESIDVLKGEYSLSDEKAFLKMQDLPSFNDDQGSVVLIDSHGHIIDLLEYHKDMHSVFIQDEEGVSLERISNLPFTSSQNWKSASSTVGFATPGYLNSNSTASVFISETLKVEPEIFNPIGGSPDFTQIHYNFEQGGYVANVKIFDPRGHLIKQLANNDLLGAKGFYRWDGDRDDGSKARIGYYMIWFEIFDEHGMTRKYQRRVAIAATF